MTSNPLYNTGLSKTTAQAIRAGRIASTGIAPKSSRPNKRKQQNEHSASVSDSEDTGFGDMAAEDPDFATPEKSDPGGASEDDDDLDTGIENELSKSGAGRKGKTLEGDSLAIDVDEPPPRRQLPFGTIGRKKIEERPEAVYEQASNKGDRKEGVVEEEQSLDGDETSDDEL